MLQHAGCCAVTFDGDLLRWASEAAIEQAVGSGEANARIVVTHQLSQNIDGFGSMLSAELQDIQLGLRAAVWITALAWFPEPRSVI
jgi:hypothetical protein